MYLNYNKCIQTDSQLTGIQCRYLTTNPSIKENLNWKQLEKRIDHNNNMNEANQEKESLAHFIPGGGVAQKWWKLRLDTFHFLKKKRG